LVIKFINKEKGIDVVLQYDYLIVGSGLFGSVFAHEALCHGKKCLVIEKRNHTGGNVHCTQVEGITVHQYGAHIFHTNNERVWNYVNQFVRFNRFTNAPIANYKGEIYNLPFNMNTFSKMWGVRTPKEAEKKIKEQCTQIKGIPKNLEQQAISLVGQDIYEKLIKGYTEKQWGRSCKDLPAFIIRRLPVRFTYDNNYFNDLYQGIPIGGYNKLIDQLLQGTEVQLETDFNECRKELLPLAKKVIYTGMIDTYFDNQFGKLEYRSLKFENEILNEPNFQGVAACNYTDRETPFTRIIEHKHFEFGTQPKTVITREYPVEWNDKMEPYYPINDIKNQKLYQMYAHLAKNEKNVLFGGRLAEYQYYNMDQVIASALEIAKRELN
jgi:UDP-galactopyranose mutase